MKKIIIAILLVNLSVSLTAKEIDLSKSEGTNQELISSLSPSPMDTTVKRGANIKITFAKKLKHKSIKLNYLGYKQEKEQTLIKAEYHGKASEEVKVTVRKNAEVINGYTLPPEPDPKINHATLLGVDSNHNGIRDDVERKILKKYPKKIQIELLFDGARVFQKILEQSTANAYDLQKEVSRIISCKIYLTDFDSLIDSDDFLISKILENMIINTPERVRKYLDYNLALSGGTFGSSPDDWNKNACSPETRKVLEEMGL